MWLEPLARECIYLWLGIFCYCAYKEPLWKAVYLNVENPYVQHQFKKPLIEFHFKCHFSSLYLKIKKTISLFFVISSYMSVCKFNHILTLLRDLNSLEVPYSMLAGIRRTLEYFHKLWLYDFNNYSHMKLMTRSSVSFPLLVSQ